jgi:hypothetical protein
MSAWNRIWPSTHGWSDHKCVDHIDPYVCPFTLHEEMHEELPITILHCHLSHTRGYKQKGILVFMNIRCLTHLRNFSQCSLCNEDPLAFWKMALQCKASALWDETWEKELHFGDVMMLTLRAADSPFPLKSSTKKERIRLQLVISWHLTSSRIALTFPS